ncbi:MAG: hypothetical protein AB8B91_00935 [Rubripirellula sp.]
MQSLQNTYETLATTRNEAAVDVLLDALNFQDEAIRRLALLALLRREESRAPMQLLRNWEKLSPKEIQLLRKKRKWFVEAIEQCLAGDAELVLSAIRAAKDLSINEVLPTFITLAESSGTLAIKQAACSAVVAMVESLGRDARADRDQPTVRGPILLRLADSVRRFSMHRVDPLVDAYLLVSTWGDGDLRQMIGGQSPERDLIRKRFTSTTHRGVIELLAGFIRRRKIPEWVGQLIQSRVDEDFRNALLGAITCEPSATVLRNLRDIGMPKSCQGGEEVLLSVSPELQAALVHLYTVTSKDIVQTLHLIAASIECTDSKVELAASLALSRCEIPEIDMWMRAAIPVADLDEEAIADDDNARLLNRLIRLLDHRDAGVVRGVRRVLEPLHADEMLHRFEALRPRSRRRLGRVVMMIDPDAINRVRDALRHPVLGNRLQAIAMADALAVVDLLSDSFAHISRDDHQEARVRAAQAMADATNSTTLGLLQEMIALPECQVRDAALSALEKRQKAKTR